MMGYDIAKVFTQAGFEVIATDTNGSQFEKGLKEITRSANKLVEKGLVGITVDGETKKSEPRNRCPLVIPNLIYHTLGFLFT